MLSHRSQYGQAVRMGQHIKLGVIAAALSLAATATQADPLIEGNSITGTRDARYCEIIPVVRDGLHLKATVYNTLGLNDCPPTIWDAITEDAAKRRFDALTVLLNGPRHFLMDSITANGATKAGETIDVQGLKLTERATIDLGLLDLLHRPYREQTINRDTIYTFKAGSPVFTLEDADGSRYVMQAYSQIVNKDLSYAQLPTLGAKLKLPSGWRYGSSVPDKDLVLGAAGKATVIQDELENTYQKVD
jgi:hypothetical protein